MGIEQRFDLRTKKALDIQADRITPIYEELFEKAKVITAGEFYLGYYGDREFSTEYSDNLVLEHMERFFNWLYLYKEEDNITSIINYLSLANYSINALLSSDDKQSENLAKLITVSRYVIASGFDEKEELRDFIKLLLEEGNF